MGGLYGQVSKDCQTSRTVEPVTKAQQITDFKMAFLCPTLSYDTCQDRTRSSCHVPGQKLAYKIL